MQVPKEPEERVRSHEPGVTGICEPPNVGVRN